MIIAGILLLLSFFVYASYSIRSAIYIKAFCKKHTTEKIVAITFDDGPDSAQTPRVLKVLKAYKAPACFFCIGSKIEGNEALLQQIVAEGHILGNHSFTHSGCFPLYSLTKIKKELHACREALERVTLQTTTLFRPPFGVTNPTLAKAIRSEGYTTIGWNIRTLDTQNPPIEKVLRRVQQKLSPGSIILLHDRMPKSDLLLEQILKLIQEQGYTVVRIDSML